jgi:hypothetical protein
MWDLYSARANDGTDYTTLKATVKLQFYSEILCKCLPAGVFLVTALVRYKEIEAIGFSKTTLYSKMYRWKKYIQYALAFCEAVSIVLYFMEPKISAANPFSSYIFEERWWSLFLLLPLIGWVAGVQLMHYEYKKRLSEAFYSHWFFWTLMFLDYVIFLGLNFQYYVSLTP